MRLRLPTLVIMAVLAGFPVAAQAPAPVAERITTHLGRTTRVSLFSNHVVVVSIRSDTEDFLHRAKLDFDEYMVYLQALERFASEIGNEPVGSDVHSRDSVATLILHIGPESPMVYRYSPLATLDLSVGKIASVMDDLQTRALAAKPGEYELEQWQPAIGDCVELRQGGTACVTAVGEDGTIELMRQGFAMTYTVAVENRAEVILEVLAETP
jgi:hypothetical protein